MVDTISQLPDFSLSPRVDQVGIEERAARFTKRSIKKETKVNGLMLTLNMIDLTTLEGSDTPGKVAVLCRKAMQPLHPRYEVPNCAAVCVYPNLVRIAKKFLECSTVKVASVATGFSMNTCLPWRTASSKCRGRNPGGVASRTTSASAMAFL